jgi:eukaryotic-like serine/threonine-protein kinase
MPAGTDTLLPPRYEDVRPIAHGGMGEIFRATDRKLGRDVAVKLLAERVSADEDSRARFKREALAAARLSGTPNIVTIFDVGEHNGRPLIVMEYFPGGSLEQRLASRAPYSAAESLDWLEEAAAALDAAHAAGVVHRDVKPANLLLDGRGHVHVADFGIASAAGLDSFTQVGTILGTAGYLSPEQAKGERATAASDLYGLAVVAWELLAGQRPFESSSPTAEAAAHANAPVPSVRAANPALPAGYDAIFGRALAKDPKARFPTAAEFVAELRRALHDDAGDTWIAPPLPATTVTGAAPARYQGWWLPLSLAVLLAAGILAAVLVSRRGGAPQPSTVVRTVTTPGQTVRETVTTRPTTAAPPAVGASGAALNNAGYAKLQAGDYAGALPLLQQAAQKLNGTGSLDEAYADYNLAYATFALGQCSNVNELLDRSQSIQGHRSEIEQLRHDVRKRCHEH